MDFYNQNALKRCLISELDDKICTPEQMKLKQFKVQSAQVIMSHMMKKRITINEHSIIMPLIEVCADN